MERIESPARGMYGRTPYTEVLARMGRILLWSPIYGTVRVDGVDGGGVRFVDGAGETRFVDASFKARVDGVVTEEGMLRPDRDPSVLWDFLGAEYVELRQGEAIEEFRRVDEFRRSIERWTDGELECGSEGMDRVVGMSCDCDCPVCSILVRSSAEHGLWFMLTPWRDAAAYAWVTEHCLKSVLVGGAEG